MIYCKNECAYVSVIAGLLAGVVLGILYALSLVATGVIFWVYLIVGIAGIFFLPIYANGNAQYERTGCGCSYKNLLIIGAVGAIVTAAVGLIIQLIAPTVAVAIILGLTTFFVVFLLVTVICLTSCICSKRTCNIN
jgi:hypothetical protein